MELMGLENRAFNSDFATMCEPKAAAGAGQRRLLFGRGVSYEARDGCKPVKSRLKFSERPLPLQP